MPPKTVLITGCSHGGVGFALAKEFHSRGFRVYATARNLASMTELENAGIAVLQLDVVDSASIKAVKAKISHLTGGKLDVLVNNAGVTYTSAISDFDMKNVRDLLNVNLTAVIEVTHEFLPLLIASGDARVIQIGSLAGQTPLPFAAAYNASKAALRAFSDTLRVEVAPFGVKVMTVLAGFIESKIMDKMDHTLKPGSIYEPIRDIYQSKRVDHFADGAITAEEFSRRVVTEALKSQPKSWFWIGPSSPTVWFMSTFAPTSVFDSVVSGMYGLTDLSKKNGKYSRRGPGLPVVAAVVLVVLGYFLKKENGLEQLKQLWFSIRS